MRGTVLGAAGLLLALVLSAAPLLGQAPSGRARASLEAGVRGSELNGSTEAIWGGVALLGVHPRVSLGGGGWLLSGKSEITGLASGSDLEMSLGYGGAVLDVLLRGSEQSRISLRALIGAGHARVLVPVVGPELNADNFGVLEPELVAARWLAGMVSLQAAVSYRFVFAVEDLTQVTASDLKGASLTLSIGIGRP